MRTDCKAMILTLGRRTEPLIKTIIAHSPEFVVFFPSHQTVTKISEVMEGITREGIKIDYQTSIVDNADDLVTCYKAGLGAVQRVKARCYADDSVVVDYTGATSTMSVGLSLAAVESGYSFSYVSGIRNDGGIGDVESGHELVVPSVNPWDFMAVPERRRASLYFNTCQFKSCRDLLRDLASRANQRRHVYDRLTKVVEGFLYWDLFRHRDAVGKIREAEELLDVADAGVASFAQSCLAMLPLLIEIHAGSGNGNLPSIPLAADLYANAERRSSEGKVDDAVLRLYRLVEMLGQQKLLESHGIDAADVPPAVIPEPLRSEFLARYTNDRDHKVKIPQAAVFIMLDSLGDPLGNLYRLRESQFRSIQNQRNNSYLAHGFGSTSEETYRKLKQFVLDLGVITPDTAPRFPQMQL